MARYVEAQILDIPAADIEESNAKMYPTALVVGPGHFIGPIYEHLASRFEYVRLKKSESPDFGLIDGYSMLRKDHRHRLGWRILCEYDTPGDLSRIITESIQGGELFDLLPPAYRQKHLQVVALIERLLRDDDLTADERERVERATGTSVSLLREQLGSPARSSTEEEQPTAKVEATLPEETKPSMVVTTLVGAKGLEAGHVFVVGVINGHFPANNLHPTDTEVCQFIVALTRARKRVFLVSARNYAGTWVDTGVFVDWVGPLVDKAIVGKNYPFES
jgi:UvrD-like helicase C-terminal domain